MTVEEFIQSLEQITQTVESGANSAWAFAAERTAQWLREQLGETTNLKNNITYSLEGTLFSVLAPSYILYQNYGVAGQLGNTRGARPDEFSGGRTHQYGAEMPPAGVFARYASDASGRFAIAKTIHKYGIRPKGWFDKDTLTQAYVDYANQFINDNL